MTSANTAPLLPVVRPPDKLRWSSLPLIGRATPFHTLLAMLLLVFFATFLIWPIFNVVATGFRTKDGAFTPDYLKLVLTNPVYLRGLMNSTLIAVLTTSLTLIIALPLAVLSVRFEFRGRAVMGGLALVPMILPPFVGAVGMRLVFSRFGPLTQLLDMLGFGPYPLGIDWLGNMRLFGVVIIEALGLYPIMLLNVQAALANIDPAMEQAAANLGAGRWTIFRQVTLPLIRPGLFAGCTLVLIWSFTELGTPLMFQVYDVTPVQVFSQITELDNPLPYALVVVMLVCSTALYLVGKVILGRSFDAATTKASTSFTPTKLRGWRAAAALAPFVIVFALAVLPHLSVILTSISVTGEWYRSILPREITGHHYVQALEDELALPSVWNSIRYAGAATLLGVVVGLAAAVVIVRSNVPFRGLIDTLAMLPLAVPGLVLAFGYLSISNFFRQTLGGDTPDWLDVQRNPVVLLILAYTARRLPYIVRSAAAGLQQTPRDLELAAANLGAKRSTILRRIMVPLILANLLAGALMAFAFAMLEVSDSLILAQTSRFYPITKAIWELSQRLGDGLHIASALGVWAMVLLTLTILSASALLGRRMGAIFRV